jgi:hypothetical protein
MGVKLGAEVNVLTKERRSGREMGQMTTHLVA